jgi:hypothetical protein
MAIISKRGRPEPAPPVEKVELPMDCNPRIIIIRPDGSWAFPETDHGLSPQDEEVLRRTAGGVDINYIQHEDC